ncbi:hypothetical protein SAMN04487895_104235 [Paenibacillus sophorae]|uniref:Uncharacterized protein n=1 Tax=Paenibacillus sophorae TaxID=1333845 RepID=A0A1H8L902_9BACL|nr:hypothetical protein SAMN04487895_104235 [Paenibacillus sophorae]
MIDVHQQCKGCGKKTPHIIDRLLHAGPRPGDRAVFGHCQECEEQSTWYSYLPDDTDYL